VVEAAWDIKRLVDGYMGHEIYRLVATNAGIDPRGFTAFVFGGAGPLHAAGFCEATDLTTAVVPHFGGVSGAYGAMTLDVQQVYEISFVTLIAGADGRPVGDAAAEINRAADALLRQSQRDLAEERMDAGGVSNDLSLLMRFGQQRHTMPVRLSRSPVDEAELAELASKFADQYAAAFGREAVFMEAGIEALGLRLEARVGEVGGGRGPLPAPESLIEDPRKGTRRAYWGPDEGWIDTRVYLRDGLPVDGPVDGPALVESEDTVCVVPPGWTYRVDVHRNGILSKVSEASWAS
jgi:N-methylhydantoinase A/oxoprolinase/acetone carboxylase beta subunit